MNRQRSQSTWVEIDLNAIQNNVRYVREHTGVHVMAVVKANGYGHGAVPVARAALQGGATWCGVARIGEAIELRRGGIQCPILILGYTPPEQIPKAIAKQISLTVWNKGQVAFAASCAKRVGIRARLHLKVDTGMSRLGTLPEEAPEIAHQIAHTREVVFEGLFTHFARADEQDKRPTQEQENRLRHVLQQLNSLGICPQYIHAANSAASLTHPTTVFNMVRLGIAMYGLHPSPECPLPDVFRPALSWKAVLSQIKTLPPGQGVSYGHEYVTRSYERIGVIPIGYADGLRRVPGNLVLIHGQRAPLIGRVCMDQAIVQLDGVDSAREGDEVVLIGYQGNEHITAEEVAQRWGTNNYEVVCAIGKRVPRFYIT